tara:strand:- start:95907 stop:96746 length:840 start_codon:yes stop_codon:yes gene_type:complete
LQNTLHILNGDSTTNGIEKGGIGGDTIIWREMLVEGPLHQDIGSDAFWLQRYSFFENEFGVSKIDYYDKTIKELVRIEDLSDYNEVVLWFEFDLFCQINLIALCTYLLQSYRKDINYYLVCTGKVKGEKQLRSLADYASNEYPELFENRIKLSRHNLLYAQQCWNVYVANNQEELAQFNFNKSAKFKYLKPAIDQHLKRFAQKNELNQIDTKIVEIIHDGIGEERAIVKELLRWQQEETVYGFGDLQYFKYLENMKTYYTIKNENYSLNALGRTIINNI